MDHDKIQIRELTDTPVLAWKGKHYGIGGSEALARMLLDNFRNGTDDPAFYYADEDPAYDNPPLETTYRDL